MARPNRSELVRRFFPELGKTGSGGETEAAIELNTRACEAVLADLIGLFDDFHAKCGEGILCLKLADGDRESFYTALSIFREDLADAEKAGDTTMAAFLREVVDAINGIDVSEKVLFMLIDNSKCSLLPIPRTYPARGIKALQEAATI